MLTLLSVDVVITGSKDQVSDLHPANLANTIQRYIVDTNSGCIFAKTKEGTYYRFIHESVIPNESLFEGQAYGETDKLNYSPYLSYMYISNATRGCAGYLRNSFSAQFIRSETLGILLLQRILLAHFIQEAQP